tara:strand:- start:22301 stop:23461 length:1161 start_codon:yes stop_codon:yes gene_type:complete
MSLKESIYKSLLKSINTKKASLHEPVFSLLEKQYLQDCIESTFVSSEGIFLEKFKKKLIKFTGSKFVIPVSSGTSALHISLISQNISYKDEVLVPALTFVATANAVKYCRAIPNFIDCNEKTLGIDVEKLEYYLFENTRMREGKCINKKTGNHIKALIPMHTFGHPSEIEEILKISTKYNLTVIEDSAEALGSFYKKKHLGTFGKLGVLSFNGNKIITTGGGGAILTKDKKLAKKITHLSTTAKNIHKWEYIHDEVGYNYRMPNLNAALGCAQMNKINIFLKSKRNLFKIYKDNFKNFEELYLFEEPKYCSSNYWLQTLILTETNAHQLDDILDYTNKKGLRTRPAWNLLSDLKPFKSSPKSNLDNSKSLRKRIINIPSSSFLPIT